jgi:hypothetical protein
MSQTINLFLPKVIIVSPATVDTTKQLIRNVIQKMNIGSVILFDLNFSKKFMHNYAFIILKLNTNESATRFVNNLNERGFAKLKDETNYWKASRYVLPEHRKPAIIVEEEVVAVNVAEEAAAVNVAEEVVEAAEEVVEAAVNIVVKKQVKDEVLEEGEINEEWDDPVLDEPFVFTSRVFPDITAPALTMMDLDCTDHILDDMKVFYKPLFPEWINQNQDMSNFISTYLNYDLLASL